MLVTLLQYGVDPRQQGGVDALSHAIQHDQFLIAELLLREGTDPNGVVNGSPLLYYALTAHAFPMADLLVHHGATVQKEAYGVPLSNMLALREDPDIMSWLRLYDVE